MCDFCGRDFTNSSLSGGFIFSGKAVCPYCSHRVMTNIKRHKESQFISDMCPHDLSFKAFVLKLRGGNNTIRIYSL